MTFIKNHALSLFLTAVIVFLSLFPFGPIELAADVPLADKWTHMLMYAVLSLALAWEFHRTNDRGSWLQFCAVVFVVPTILGGLLELAQAYCTDYRSGEWLDFVADSIGALAGLLIGACMSGRKKLHV